MVIKNRFQIIKAFCNDSVFEKYEIILNNGQLELLWSSVVSIFLVGGAIGSLAGSLLADRIGRKGALITSSVLGVMAGVLFFSCKAATSVEMLVMGRLFVGLSSGINFTFNTKMFEKKVNFPGLITTVMPMYLMELSPLHLRGATGVLCPLGVTTGVLLGQIFSINNILGNTDYWPHLLTLYAVPQAICCVIIFILPESPKYLYIVKNEPEIALQRK